MNHQPPRGQLTRLYSESRRSFQLYPRESEETVVAGHNRIARKIPLSVKNHVMAMAAEFAGTFMFLLFAFGGTNVVNQPPDSVLDLKPPNDPAKLLYISLCFGMSLAVNVWIFFRVSGGMFNPAVSIGMVLVGAIDYVRCALVIIGQIAGATAAAGLLRALLPGSLNVSVSLGGGASVAQGLFIEMLLTTQLVFTIFMLAAEKHRATFIAPVGIGLSLFIAELLGVYYTGGAVNPARAFAPSVVYAEFESYHWIYWAGPVLGSLLATGIYTAMRALEYETINPGQDASGKDKGKILDRSAGAEMSILQNKTQPALGRPSFGSLQSPRPMERTWTGATATSLPPEQYHMAPYLEGGPRVY